MTVRIPAGAEELLRHAIGYQEAGKEAQALPLFVRAAEMLAPLNPPQAAQAWRQAGCCAAQVFDADTAVECFHRAITLLAPAGDPAPLARLYNDLATACYAACRLREAEAAACQADSLARAARSARDAAAAAHSLGLVARYRGRPQEALRCFVRARRLYRLAGEPLNAADTLHSAGWVLLDMGELIRAETALHLARAERKRLGAQTGRIDVELARLRLRRGDAAAARALARRIADSAEARLDPLTHVQALVVAAEAAEEDTPQSAVSAAELALDLARSLGRPPVVVDLLLMLVRLRRRTRQALREIERRLLLELASEVEELAQLCEPDSGRERGRAEAVGEPGDGRAARWAGGHVNRLVGDCPSAPTGQQIRALRTALGWTQEYLAERAGFEVTTVKRAERGARVPERTLRMLAAAMGVMPATAGHTVARYWRHLGRAHEALHEHAEARQAYARAADISRAEGDLVGEILAEIRLASLDLRENRPGGVAGRLARYRRILESLGEASACVEIDRLLAEALVATGRASVAIPHLRRLLATPGITAEDRVELLEALARAYRAMGQTARAEATMGEAADLRTDAVEHASARIQQYAREAMRLHGEGRAAEAAYVAEVAARWALVTRTLARGDGALAGGAADAPKPG
jgi:tetratricopeptide (TPR) repeat protein